MRRKPVANSRTVSAEVTPDGVVTAARQPSDGPSASPWIGRPLAALMATAVGNRSAADWEHRIEHARNTRGAATYVDLALDTDAVLAPRPLATVITPVPGAGGDLPARILVHCTERPADATGDELVDDVLKDLEASIVELVWIIGETGAASYTSPRWSAVTGWPAPSLAAAGYMELVHPEDRANLRPDGFRGRDGFDFRLLHADGNYRWMRGQASPVPERIGDLPRWVLSATESNPVRDDTFAREVQEQLRVALSLAGFGRYAIYFREPRVDADARYSEIIGRDAQEIMTTEGLDGLFNVVHKDDVERVKATLEGAMHDGSTYDMEYRIWQQTSDGPAPRRVVARGRVEQDANGPLRIVGVLEDVTEARVEAELRVLRQKREALGSLAGGVAHDFNNVISAILSNARVAQDEIAAGEFPTMSLQEIVVGATLAGELVQRMLTFSRDEEPARRDLHLGEITEEVEALLRPTLGSRTSLSVVAEPSLPLLSGDSTQMHQLLLNLITNAGHAIGEAEGRIEVTLDAVAITSIDDAGVRPGAYVRLRVVDDGPGIPESVLPRIFDPFFTTKPSGEGTGLGLAVAQTIVQSHGGGISARCPAEGGTVFAVHLPLPAPSDQEAVAELPPLPQTAGALPGGAMRVLFVDDEEALTRLAQRAMPLLGCAVTAVTDPVRALDHLERQPEAFDLLVTDLAMPKLSGLELVARVRALRSELPVVLTSGFLTEQTRAAAARLQVDAIVPKPCSMDDLIRAALDARAARSSS